MFGHCTLLKFKYYNMYLASQLTSKKNCLVRDPNPESFVCLIMGFPLHALPMLNMIAAYITYMYIYACRTFMYLERVQVIAIVQLYN